MTRETLQNQSPSKDPQFADKVQDDLQAVQKLHRGLMPALETLLTKVLGREVEVEIHEAHQRMFGYYIQSLGKLCCDYCFTMEPLEGRVFLDLSLPLCVAVLQPDADDGDIARAVESRLATPIGESWVTPDEIDTLNSSAKGIIEALEEAWKPVRDMNSIDIELETVPSFIGQIDAGAPAIHLVMKVESEGRQDLEMYLCYPLSTLDPALPDLK
jgi:flagellar motor switch protein FliM